MALPILETATYELTLPSKDVKVKFRPFLVKEEKLLVLANETKEEEEENNAKASPGALIDDESIQNNIMYRCTVPYI